jgi:hypothetical protein
VPDASTLVSQPSLITDAWDVLAGAVPKRGAVLLYDDNGGHAGLDTARVLLEANLPLEYVTPERMLGPDIGGSNYPQYAKAFAAADDCRVTLLHTLDSVDRREDGRLTVRLYSEHADRVVERVVDHLVVEQGTAANDELYHDLVPQSLNFGAVNYDALLALRPQDIRTNPGGSFQLFRVGDAVSSRNIHAAVYDAYRLCLAI